MQEQDDITMLVMRIRQTETPKKHLSRCWMRSETVWAILHNPMIRRMQMVRKMMKKIPSCASWAKMTNVAGWWAQYPKPYNAAWRDFCGSRWSLMNSHNWDGGTRPITSITEIRSTGWPNWRIWWWLGCNRTKLQPHLHCNHFDSLWRPLISSLEYSQMLQGTSRPGSCHMRLGSGEPQCHKHVASQLPDQAPDSSLIMIVKPVEPVSFCTCRLPP